MENVEEFMTILEQECYVLSVFKLSCMFKDICLKNYNYKPRLSNCNQIIHEWENYFIDKTLTVDIIRQMFEENVRPLLHDLEIKYLVETQKYDPSDEIHNQYMRKVKKLAENDIMIRNGILYKEFIDCYRNGYFN